MRMVAHHKEGVIVLLRRHEPPPRSSSASSAGATRAARKWDPRLHGIGAQILQGPARRQDAACSRGQAHPQHVRPSAWKSSNTCRRMTRWP
jgi:hypothetical protein